MLDDLSKEVKKEGSIEESHSEKNVEGGQNVVTGLSLKVETSGESGNDEDDRRVFKTTDETLTDLERSKNPIKRTNNDLQNDDDFDEPMRKRSRRGKDPKIFVSTLSKTSKSSNSNGSSIKKHNGGSNKTSGLSKAVSKILIEPKDFKNESTANNQLNAGTTKGAHTSAEISTAEVPIDEDASEVEEDEVDSDEEGPELAAKAREKVQSTLKTSDKDPYPDWPPGDPVPYAALCTTFSLVEMTTKRLIISAHCSLFLRQVLRLTPEDLLPTVQLMINKLAADYAGIELGIGESLIMKAIGDTTGRSLQVIKADQKEIGDLGLVAAKSRSNQPTMYKPKALTVKGVLDGLMGIAVISGDGSQSRKVAGIKKLLSAADASLAEKCSKGIDITKDKGGASEAKFIIRFLEGKLRLGLAEKTVLVALAHAMVIHETSMNGDKLPSSEQLAKGETILKTVYR